MDLERYKWVKKIEPTYDAWDSPGPSKLSVIAIYAVGLLCVWVSLCAIL